MDKLRIFLTSKIGWIMEVLITVTILFTSLFLPTAFVDIAVSVTIILMVVGVYAIYGFFFNKEKRTAYGFLLFNIFLSMMFANRLYIYDNLVHIFPIIDQVDCGIMISASHNPYYDNGIKLIDCYGEKMPEETLLLVEDYIDGKLHVFDKDWPELPFAHREHIGRTVDYVAGRNRYMGYLISLGIYSFKGVKVGLDCANGASWNIAKSVFDALGADTYVINNQPNGLNINLNAGSTHIEGLQKFVVEKGLDVGFAYDGDADRCLCVDEKGNVITGDHILYIYGCYMKERGKLLTNTVVTTVMSNFGLYKAFDEQGIGYAKTAVGDKYVYEYMAKNGCRIGGEQSGHIIFSKYASTGDGILTSLKMMEVMLAKKMPMSKLAEPLKIYPQVLENVRVTDKKAAQNDPAVQEAVKAVAEALGDTGRILVRESGTEPLVRVMVEAPDHDTCQKYVDEVVNVIDSKGYRV